MKKLRLLLAFCALLLGWSNASANQTLADNGVYYIQNVETGLFLSRGGAYGAHALADNYGLAWRLTGTNGSITLQMYDIYSEGFTSGGLGDNSFVDNGSPLSNWTLEGDANGYTIKTGSTYLTASGNTAGSDVVIDGNGTGNKTWILLSDAEHAAVLAAKTSAQESAIATAASIDLGGSTLSEILGNTSNWRTSNIPVAAPTSSGVWTYTENRDQGGANNYGDYGTELYNKSGKFTKTISDLENGIYKLTVKSMHRSTHNAPCWTVGESFTNHTNSYVLANGYYAQLKDWKSAAEKNGNDYNPNSTGQFKTKVEAGNYATDIYTYVSNGTLDITVSQEGFWYGEWFAFNGVTLTYYSDKVSDDDATAILATATSLEDQEMDAAILSALSSAKSTFNGARTIANYNALQTAIDNAQASADAYALFAPERTKALALGMDEDDVAALAPNVNNLKVAEYNFVTTTYPYGVELGEWTSEGTNTSAATFNNEHWSGTTHDYKNQYDGNGQGWNANSWSINFSQDVLLPAGTYVFKVAGRQASGDQVTTSLVVKKGEEELGSVNDFPRSNNSRGINKSGETAFEGNNEDFAHNGAGYGWEWRYVKFTLAEEATVNIAINSVATAIHQWVSFGDYTLQADNDDVVDILAYNVAKASAITVCDDAQYVNVTGSERTALVNAINADPSSDYPAATTALDEARVAFIGAKTSYDNFVAAKAVEYEDNLPYASATKFAAIATAQEAADATSASDAVAKTNAIISAYRKYVESNALAEGVGGIDKTNLISDANFSGVTIVDQTAGAWAFSQPGGNAAILSGESFTDGDGNASYSYFDYNNDGANNQNLSQTLTALPKGQYLLTVTARATSAMDGNYYLSVEFDETSAKEAIPAIGNTGGTFGRGWNDVSVVFNHVSDGDVTIHVYGQNGKAGWSGATRFRLAKIDKVATIGSTGWTTFASPYALDLSSMTASSGEVAAYYASATSAESVTVLPIESSAVQAGEGLLLKGTAGVTITIPVVASGDAISGNLMVGCPTATNITSSTPEYGTCYVLGVESEKAVFQNVKNYIDGGNTVNIPAGKAYLNATASNGARSMRIVFGDITGVANVEAASEAKAKDGKFIENGKLVIVKNGQKFNAAGQQVK